MKLIQKNKITNIPNSDTFDNLFLFPVLQVDYSSSEREVFFMKDLIKQKENTQLLENL